MDVRPHWGFTSLTQPCSLVWSKEWLYSHQAQRSTPAPWRQSRSLLWGPGHGLSYTLPGPFSAGRRRSQCNEFHCFDISLILTSLTQITPLCQKIGTIPSGASWGLHSSFILFWLSGLSAFSLSWRQWKYTKGGHTEKSILSMALSMNLQLLFGKILRLGPDEWLKV